MPSAVRRLLLGAALLITTITITASAQSAPQVRLADDLGFPGEGYCIDVVGVWPTARADLPLVMHNCLPGRGSVDRVAQIDGNRIVFPAFDACVTAFAVNVPLPGAPVMLRPCGGNESFLPTDRLQQFERDTTGRLRLTGTALCLTAGPDAARTFSSTHRWRTLTLETCDTAPAALSVWE